MGQAEYRLPTGYFCSRSTWSALEVQADSRLVLHRSPPGSKPDDNVFTGNEIKANEWMHLVGVRDSDGKTMKMYVNGQKLRLRRRLVSRWGTVISTLLWSALRQWADRAFNGQLDDLRIYKSALSTELVGNIYG